VHPPADRSQTSPGVGGDSSQAVSVRVSARHRARAVVGERRFELIVSTSRPMAMVALLRATSVMVAR